MRRIRFYTQQLLNNNQWRRHYLATQTALSCAHCFEGQCCENVTPASHSAVATTITTTNPTTITANNAIRYVSASTKQFSGFYFTKQPTTTTMTKTMETRTPQISCSASAELLKRARWWSLLRHVSYATQQQQIANQRQNYKATAAAREELSKRNFSADEFEDQNNKKCEKNNKNSKAKEDRSEKETQKTCAMEAARIVIIGAGAAGIAAATRLLQSGFENVLILEAENRYGGRIHTIQFGDNVVDLGAQWCHGEKRNVIYEMVRDCDMLAATGTAYDDYKCVRSNKEVLSEVVSNELKAIVNNLLLPARQEGLKEFEGSLGTFLTEAFWRDLLENAPEIDKVVAREFFENYKKFESSIEASDTLFEVSGRGYLDYWVCEGDLLLNWKDKGFRSFLRFLMKSKTDAADSSTADTNALAEDLGLLNKRIKFNARVQNIEWRREPNAHNVRIRLWNGELIEADHVICTVSLGVLKECHQKLFTPALPPAKCRAIDGLKLGTVNKLFLEFANPFEPSDWPGFCFLWREEDLIELRNSEYFWLESVFGFYRVSYQPRLLQGWIIGPHARHMETLPEAKVLASLLWLFAKFFTFKVPAPVSFLRTRWYTNPNFRGSYTFRTMYADELGTGGSDLATPLMDERDGKPLLLFAGEATHTHFYSTVHGAVESGWREAQRLSSYYTNHNSQL